MFGITPPFWSGYGDHPPGDGLTIFQTAFAGAVSDDISVSQLGAGTELGPGTKNAGYYECDFDAVATFNRGITWPSFTELSQGALSPLTAEMFVDLIEIVANPAVTSKFAQLSFGTNMSVDFHMASYGAFFAGINSLYVTRSGSTNFESAYDIFDEPGLIHLAVVFRTDGTADVYAQGIRIITGAGYAAGASGTFQMGGSATSYANRFTARYYGGRVRRAIMYTGASFTPPLSPADWGPP